MKGAARAAHRGLLGMLLAGPFVLAPAIAVAVAPAYGPAITLAALCATFGLSWLIALHLASSARFAASGLAALVGASLLAGGVAALSGGFGAPAASLLAIVTVEAWLLTRSWKVAVAAAALAGVAAALTGMVAAPVALAWTGWQWLTPALYAAGLALRGHGSAADAASMDAADSIPVAALDAIVLRLSQNGEVDTVSERARDMIEIDPELLLGVGFFERIHVSDRVGYLHGVSQARQTGRTRHCEVRVRMPIGNGRTGTTYRPFTAEILRDEVCGQQVTVILRDAGELAALRDDIVQAGEQANAVDVAKGRFLATVSHELRTPLNAIIGFSDMLLMRISGELDAKQDEHVRLIREAGNHLLSVVNAILDVSKIEAGTYQINVEPFEPKPAVELCCAMLEPQAAQKGVSVAARLQDGLGEIAGDQRAFQQILINLLSNAIKFTPEGGAVTVTATRQECSIRIYVNDNGIGISAEDLAQLGKPFMQVQSDYTRRSQGTGLGLSLVKGLVKLHEGSMSIESAPGLGTTVAVELPVAETTQRADTVADEDEWKGETGERDGTALRKIA